ncbi:RDD family protein [Agromyces italicus]|uniref:RDD family protein n=1 Tax=Agromyces italicus TaxID=279572 RepID=UPI00041E9063|nr:RDD family protein [Agromyces italicus]
MSVTMDIDDEPTPGLRPDGRPDPGYARAIGLVPAPSGRRAGAFALDAVIWAVLATPTLIGVLLLIDPVIASGGDPTRLGSASAGQLIAIAIGQTLVFVFGLVQLVLHGRRGVTVGKAAAGLRSVSVRDFGPAGFWRIVLRALVLWAGQLVVPLVGPAILFASGAWDPERRGRSWLDRVGGCYVVDARRALDPFDARAMRRARRVAAAPPEAEAVRLPSLASDRAPGAGLHVPAERSSSGVVSSGASSHGEWAPPPVGVPAGPAQVRPVAAAVAAPAASSPPAARAAPPPSAAPLRVILRFDDGTSVEASDFGLLGRAPVGGATPAQLVPVDDPTKRISKVHAEFGARDGAFWLADRGSTNGTEVRHPDGRAETLEPGVRVALGAGTVVVIGGRSFTIETEPGR